MSDLQLYIAIGIPSIAVLIGVLANVLQVNSINARFASGDARLSSLESLENRFDARFNNLEAKFDILLGKVIELDNRVTRIAAKLDLR